ncbi:MAG: hypothetical protein Q4F49_10170 [Pseudoxanthomonas suwonensis]|nr:hypothetical protein [Pseudoxanthomonas suwonensis]
MNDLLDDNRRLRKDWNAKDLAILLSSRKPRNAMDTGESLLVHSTAIHWVYVAKCGRQKDQQITAVKKVCRAVSGKAIFFNHFELLPIPGKASINWLVSHSEYS